MLTRKFHLGLMALAALMLSCGRAGAMGEILGQSKEELKLQYEVAVHDYGNERISVEFTLADEGRLKPLRSVELQIPTQAKEKDGSTFYDLVVPVELVKSNDGKRVARFEIRKEWAERAEIWLSTNTFDGKPLVMTHYHFIIPLAPYVKNAAAPSAPAKPKPPAAAPTGAPSAAGEPPATERKKD